MTLRSQAASVVNAIQREIRNGNLALEKAPDGTYQIKDPAKRDLS